MLVGTEGKYSERPLYQAAMVLREEQEASTTQSYSIIPSFPFFLQLLAFSVGIYTCDIVFIRLRTRFINGEWDQNPWVICTPVSSGGRKYARPAHWHSSFHWVMLSCGPCIVFHTQAQMHSHAPIPDACIRLLSLCMLWPSHEVLFALPKSYYLTLKLALVCT